MTYRSSQARESNQSCSFWPIPQPQQRRIRATSVTYTIAHSKARSLTHWARPGIEPASSWLLVGFITAEPQWKLLRCYFISGYCYMNLGKRTPGFRKTLSCAFWYESEGQVLRVFKGLLIATPPQSSWRTWPHHVAFPKAVPSPYDPPGNGQAFCWLGS